MEDRVPCPDDMCTGILGANGCCGTCGTQGTRGTGGAALFSAGVPRDGTTPVPEALVLSVEPAAPEGRTAGDDPGDTVDTVDTADRVPCADGMCTGILGKDGRCGTCGLAG